MRVEFNHTEYQDVYGVTIGLAVVDQKSFNECVSALAPTKVSDSSVQVELTQDQANLVAKALLTHLKANGLVIPADDRQTEAFLFNLPMVPGGLAAMNTLYKLYRGGLR